MGRISCGCGHSFSDGAVPCSYEYNLISDLRLEELIEEIINALGTSNDIFVKIGYLLSSNGSPTYKCPDCSGILIFWDGLENPATYYKEDK